MNQAFQTMIQFLTVLVAELIALYAKDGHPPASLADLYLPVLLATAAALAIWAGSKVHMPDGRGG